MAIADLMNLSEQARGVGDGREACRAAVHGVTMTE